jgi:hypothetical protein
MATKIKTKQPKKLSHELTPRLESELVNSKIVSITTEPLVVHHAVNIGDLWACMGAIKRCYELLNRKVILLQSINRKAAYYHGAVHPTTDEAGELVSMNTKMWDMVKPLIEAQEYIEYADAYKGQKIDLDFDVIRSKTFVNLPNGAIQQWIPLAFVDLQFDLSKAWMSVKGKCPKHIYEQVKGKIILNFTERYRNGSIKYFFLQNYKDELIFSGTKKEHELFCRQWELDIPYLEVNDFLELAHAIKNARFILGVQSQLWNLAEALKTPRILEICQFAANCQIMVGEDSYGYLHQIGAEWSFQTLAKKYK